jgi:hypothetical protein
VFSCKTLQRTSSNLAPSKCSGEIAQAQGTVNG